MTKREQKQTALVAEMEAHGFDRSYATGRDGVRVRCSQCEALVISGVATHETGCPNTKDRCKECDALIPRRHRLCESCAEDRSGWHDGQEDLADYHDRFGMNEE
jgi:hypothetical protein